MVTAPPLARTPLDQWHAAHGGRFAARRGWQVAAGYATVEKECAAVRDGLGLADISATSKVSLRGAVSAAALQSLWPHTSELKPRQATTIPETGIVVCRLTADQLLLLGSPFTDSPQLGAGGTLLQSRAANIVSTDMSSALAGFCLLGSRVEDCLRRVTQLDTRAAAFPANTCAEISLAGVESLLVRLADLSVPSMRIYIAWDMAEYVWERLLEAGHDLGIAPIGLDALAKLAIP